MKIEDLKVGLYFTLPEENLEETRKYGNDFNKDCYWEDRYNFYTVISHENQWYMLNTRSIPYYSLEDKKDLEKYMEKITKKQDDIYMSAPLYKNPCRITLTQNVLDLFNFAFDLRDCKALERRESQDYKKEDVFEVVLYNPGPNMSFLVKKDTKPDAKQQQLAILRDFSDKVKAPPCYTIYHENLLKELEEIEGKNEVLVEEIRAYTDKIKEFEEELENMENNFEWFDPMTGRVKITKLDAFSNK